MLREENSIEISSARVKASPACGMATRLTGKRLPQSGDHDAKGPRTRILLPCGPRALGMGEREGCTPYPEVAIRPVWIQAIGRVIADREGLSPSPGSVRGILAGSILQGRHTPRHEKTRPCIVRDGPRCGCTAEQSGRRRCSFTARGVVEGADRRAGRQQPAEAAGSVRYVSLEMPESTSTSQKRG